MKKCEMFCYQCQETARGTGCTKVGVCGKRPELSSMLDLLIYVTKGLSCVTTKLREEGKEIGKDVNHLVTVNLFTTITNANFDRDAIVARIKETLKVKEDLRSKLTDLDSLPEAALWNGSESEFDAKADSDAVGVLSTENEDIRSLREMITYPPRSQPLSDCSSRSSWWGGRRCSGQRPLAASPGRECGG